MALSKLFGKNPELEKLPDELRELLLQMRNERNAMERLAARVEGSLKQAQELAEPIGHAQGQLQDIETRLANAQKIAARFDALQKGIEQLGARWKDTENRLRLTTNRTERAQVELEELKKMLVEAMTLRDELPGILELTKPMDELRRRAAGLQAQFGDLTEQFGAVQRDHKALQGAGAEALAQFKAIDADWRRIRLEMEARVAGFEQTAHALEELLGSMPQVAQDLEGLRALSDYVADKISTIEGQRDMVERAVADAQQLTALVETIDGQLEQHQSTTKWMAQVQDRVAHLKRLHEDLLKQTELVVRQQTELQAGGKEQYERFEQLAAGIDGAGKRLATERDEVQRLSEHVAEMEAVLTDLKQRLPEVHETRSAIVAIGSDAEQLGARLAAIAKEVEQVQSDAESVDSLRSDVRRIWATAQDLDRRLKEIVQPAVETARRTEARMTEVHAAVEALEKRAAGFESIGRRLERLETGLAEAGEVEARMREMLDAARDRQGQLEGVLYDLERLASASGDTLEQARAVGELRRQVEERQQGLAALVEGLEDLGRRTAALDHRAKLLAAAEKQATRLEETADEVRALIRTLQDQKRFLERVLDAADRKAGS